jgi:hypothetical protein
MGPKFTIETPGPPLTLEEIFAFEKEIGGQLPEDYRQFLLVHNGGGCMPRLGLSWAGSIHRIPAFIQLLPSAYDGIRAALGRLQRLNRRKAKGFVPIASTFSDYEICLAHQGSGFSGAFITAYKYDKRGYSIDVTMVRLANSFTEFLDSLVEIPNPYCRIVDLGEKGTPGDLACYLAEGNSINALGKNDLTILCEAIKCNNIAMIQACIEHGASFSRALEIAAKNKSSEAIKMLAEAGADVNECDEDGYTPLEYIHGLALGDQDGTRSREVYKLLVQLGATDKLAQEPPAAIELQLAFSWNCPDCGMEMFVRAITPEKLSPSEREEFDDNGSEDGDPLWVPAIVECSNCQSRFSASYGSG